MNLFNKMKYLVIGLALGVLANPALSQLLNLSNYHQNSTQNSTNFIKAMNQRQRNSKQWHNISSRSDKDIDHSGNLRIQNCSMDTTVRVQGQIYVMSADCQDLNCVQNATLYRATVNGDVQVSHTKATTTGRVYMLDATVNGDVIFPEAGGIVYAKNSSINGRVVGGKVVWIS